MSEQLEQLIERVKKLEESLGNQVAPSTGFWNGLCALVLPETRLRAAHSAALRRHIESTGSALPVTTVDLVDPTSLQAGIVEQLSPRTRSLVRQHVRNVLIGVAVLIGLPAGFFGWDLREQLKEATAEAKDLKESLTADVESQIKNGVIAGKQKATEVFEERVNSSVNRVIDARVKAEAALETTQEVTRKLKSIKGDLERSADVASIVSGLGSLRPDAIADLLAEKMKTDPDLLLPGATPLNTIVAVYSSWTPKDEIRTGWFLCDGGQRHGQTLPDLRGYFLRGVDPTGQIDPDANRPIGDGQADMLKSHSHDVTANYLGTVGGDMRHKGWAASQDTVSTHVRTSSEAGGRETRPKNIAINWLIYRGKPR